MAVFSWSSCMAVIRELCVFSPSTNFRSENHLNINSQWQPGCIMWTGLYLFTHNIHLYMFFQATAKMASFFNPIKFPTKELNSLGDLLDMYNLDERLMKEYSPHLSRARDTLRYRAAFHWNAWNVLWSLVAAVQRHLLFKILVSANQTSQHSFVRFLRHRCHGTLSWLIHSAFSERVRTLEGAAQNRLLATER